MAVRILCRCQIKSVQKSVMSRKAMQSFIRFESTFPAYKNDTDSAGGVDLQLFYSKFPEAEGFVNLCKQYQLNERMLARVIEKDPQIVNINTNRISSNIQQFLDLGFEPAGIATIIKNYPRILDFGANEIINSFETWRKGQLNERYLRKLFIEHSWLFSVDKEQVIIRLHRIFYLMKHKINRVHNLLLKAPTVMIDDWEEVEDKFMYCLKEMRYSEKDISKSTALAQSMSLIKLRHLFVERTGVYIRPGLKELPGMNPHKNPSLADILDSGDKQFAISTAKVSPDEYRVFLKLMRCEEEAREDTDEETDEKRDSEFDEKYH